MSSRSDSPFHRPPGNTACGVIGYAAVAVVAGLLAYFSLRSSSYLSEIGWLPRQLARWADRHGVLRNTVAYFPFGLLVFSRVGRGWLPVLATTGFAVAIEVPQYWMPRREFDLRDIAAGWAGLGASWLCVWFWAGVRRVLPAPVSRP